MNPLDLNICSTSTTKHKQEQCMVHKTSEIMGMRLSIALTRPTSNNGKDQLYLQSTKSALKSKGSPIVYFRT